MTDDGLKLARVLRVGMVSSDPLRQAGFEAFFANWSAGSPEPAAEHVQLVTLNGVAALEPAVLQLVIVDAACVPNPLELIAALLSRDPCLKVLVVGLDTSFDYIERMIGGGARGYLTHEASERELRMALTVVLDGSVWAPRKVLANLLDRERRTRERATLSPLTKRERDVLHHLSDGKTNREIGLDLQIDEVTVKAHVGRLMRKLGVSNRTALTMRAAERGLLNVAR